ncbi:Diacylglycerol kinase [Vanrija albida]|uniref:Diacylglycerol kinase n=1 Tax=Vanrija albida TaxID=181172 RepID=A0ABR3Q5B2_9TREE
MALAALPRPLRAASPSTSYPRSGSPSSPRIRASASPAPHLPVRGARRSSMDKENAPPRAAAAGSAGFEPTSPKSSNGYWSDSRSVRSGSEDEGDGPRRRSAKSPPVGVATLPTVPDDAELKSDGEASVFSESAPPPSRSALPGAVVYDANGRPVVRRRRSSSIKTKPPPGVTPTKAVDWEIPRKTFHSSIGFVTLYLKYLDPPTLGPLIKVLSSLLAFISVNDALRLNIPAFAEAWEATVGFLMRESERDKVNGTVWYLVGVIFVLALYPRDVAVVSILTLSWSDTTASTIGRLWGKYTPPLPPHFPGVKWLPFAPRKSLAGFLAAAVTGFGIGVFYHWAPGTWAIIDGGLLGRIATGVVVGLGGAVVEALDLGFDDNLTLPILSGAVVWAWLAATNAILGY